MKRLLNILIAALLFQALLNCEVDENVDATIPQGSDKDNFYVKKIGVTSDPLLQEHLRKLTQLSSGRTAETVFGEINADSAVKVNNPHDGTIRYSLLFRQQPGSSFENLIIRVRGKEVNYYKMLHEPSMSWLSTETAGIDWSKYSGKITLRNMENKHVIVADMEKGRSVNISSTSGRTKTCCEFIVEPALTGWYVAIDCGTDYYWSSFLRSMGCSGGGESSDGGGDDGGSGGSGGSGGTGGSGEEGGGGSEGGTGGGTGDNVGVFIPEFKICPGDDAQVPLTYVCPGEEGDPTIARAALLNAYLAENPYGLLNIPCSQLPQWQQVALHAAPESVLNKIITLKQDQTVWSSFVPFSSWDIQHLNDANGTVVNMDYYSTTIDQLPAGMTASQFLEHIRKNINSFVDPTKADFEPFNEAEGTLWQSGAPLGSIIHIDMGNNNTWAGGWNFVTQPDDGSVICSKAQADQWIFTTIQAPGDGQHPVSGNRQFGFMQNTNGSYTFFTRGVDRATGTIENMAQNYGNFVFSSSDALWASFMQGIRNYVNSNGGSAPVVKGKIVARPDWVKVQDYLNGLVPIESLGCN